MPPFWLFFVIFGVNMVQYLKNDDIVMLVLFTFVICAGAGGLGEQKQVNIS